MNVRVGRQDEEIRDTESVQPLMAHESQVGQPMEIRDPESVQPLMAHESQVGQPMEMGTHSQYSLSWLMSTR